MITLLDAIKYLREKGFCEDFIIKDGHVIEKTSKQELDPRKLVIEEVFRIDEDSAGEGQSVAYGIKSKDDHAGDGILITGYGIYTDPKADAQIEKMQRKQTV